MFLRGKVGIDFSREILKGYDIIAILNRVENVDAVRRAIKYCKDLTPSTKILTYGQASNYIPSYFTKYSLDAIIHSGDWELIIKKFVNYVKGVHHLKNLNGLIIRKGNNWVKTGEGERLPPNKWGFPALDLLPLEDYNKIYEKEKNISGIRGKKELSLTVSRGCPYNCIFCPAPKIDGSVERRRSVNSVINFVTNSFSKYDFDYVSMFSPTFTLNREWVVEFCSKVVKNSLELKWKCVTTINDIDEKLIKIMSDAGCFRIGFGVESLEKEPQKNIGKFISEKKLEKIIKTCLKYNITPLCFVMVGIPGQTKDGVRHTIKKIYEMGGESRLSIYTPYYKLNDNMSEREILSFKRMIINHKLLSNNTFVEKIFKR